MGPLNSEETQGETNVTKRHGRLKIRVTGTGNEHHNCLSDGEMHPELPKTTQGKTAETSQEQQRGRGRIERRAVLCKDAESNGPQTRPEVLWCAGNKLRHTHTQSSVPVSLHSCLSSGHSFLPVLLLAAQRDLRPLPPPVVICPPLAATFGLSEA